MRPPLTTLPGPAYFTGNLPMNAETRVSLAYSSFKCGGEWHRGVHTQGWAKVGLQVVRMEKDTQVMAVTMALLSQKNVTCSREPTLPIPGGGAFLKIRRCSPGLDFVRFQTYFIN